MKQVKLTQTEINHILNLIESNKEEGFYYGNKDQYWKRSSNIENKLMSKNTKG
jgi:hypothetical protein